MKKLRYTFAALLITAAAVAQPPVSVSTLLQEMVNRDARAEFPSPAFTCKQFSSHDRATTTSDQPGWFGNWDFNQYLRTDTVDGRIEQVMMDTEGPGAIVRFWMTFAGPDAPYGILRIYIDGASTPVVEGPAWDVISGNLIVDGILATGVSQLTPREQRGHNLFYPIPYAKHCKVTYEPLFKEGQSVFYNINYRTYAPGTKVKSFSMAEVRKNASLTSRIQRQLTDKDRGLDRMKLTQLSLDADLNPGDSRSFRLSGSQAIEQLGMRLQAAHIEQALRSTVLEIAFDGERTVWAPVGDFFCIGYHPLYSSTWYTQTSPEGMMECFWVMPFRDSCTITLHNMGTERVSIVDAAAFYKPWKWTDRSMHFGTSWRQFTEIDTGGKMDESEGLYAQDINFATLSGRGVYVGDGVVLYNTASTWWGEGDEKVFIDGERHPSHIGTGTEDYYCYAWGRPETFTDHPFVSQPDGSGNLVGGYAVNTRLRGLDAIPFTRSLQFDLELWHWARTRMNYAPISFWYLKPGGTTAITPDEAGARHPVALARTDIYRPIPKLVLECENIIVESITSGYTEVQSGHRNPETGLPTWSEGSQIYWNGARVGDRMVVGFESDNSGRYHLNILPTIAPDYGTFDLYFNDKLIASGVDLYHPTISTREISLGDVDLQKGHNTITIELRALPGDLTTCCFGLDRLTLWR